MPRKIRELKKLIQQAGYVCLQGRGKGSHTFWIHPLLPDEPLTIPGKDGDDAPRYLEKEVNRILSKLTQQKDQPEEQ